MSFENIVLNPEEAEITDKIDKIEEKRLNLFQEVDLPSEKRSGEFKQFLEEKYVNLSGEENFDELEEDFIIRKYFDHFNFKEEDLKNKDILDLGCGPGYFVKYCLDENITSEAYGFDLEMDSELAEGKYRDHLQKGDFTKKIPFQDKKFDYILASASLEDLFVKEKNEEAKEVLESLLSLLKDEGEMRVYPLRKIPPEIAPEETKRDKEKMERLLQAKKARENWKKVLNDLKEENLIDFKIQPIDIRVLSYKKDFWLEELLIISKISH